PVEEGGALFNSAVILGEGRALGRVDKAELPNYGVFDERRYFTPGRNGPLADACGAAAGVSVCEDIWVTNDLLARQAADGARLLVNLSSSPYRLGAKDERLRLVGGHARRLGLPMLYCNLVGGQDELVFDGGSFACGPDGALTARARFFEEELLIVDVPPAAPRPALRNVAGKGAMASTPPPVAAQLTPPLQEEEEIYSALRLGVRDYVRKNGFKAVVVALSGGVDSALTAAVAADALGPEAVTAVYLPSPSSSPQSDTDARVTAANLGIPLLTLPIEGLMKEYERSLDPLFAGRARDITEENIQSRIRGSLLMALSNKFGWLALTTDNKSEIAVGYCTLYGDTVGGFAVIKDLFKTKVYALCRWRNLKAGGELIPRSVIAKEPSAELKHNQRDSDSLPEYPVLDRILEEYIERRKDIDEIEKLGYSKALVRQVVRMVDKSEYKRRQGPIGVKITPKAFGRDRRHPITNRFENE
ncbi:MAG: NAD+ synthase, partial [Nitrospinae bacterium]|nr:NAD+ synthase [Nitrospinota bacterium]